VEDTCNTVGVKVTRIPAGQHGPHFKKYAAVFADIDARNAHAPVDSYDLPLDWVAGMSPDANHGLIKHDSRR
jgi:hypothetical protein